MKSLFRIAVFLVIVAVLIAPLASSKTDKPDKDAWMGVYTQSVSDDLAKGFKLPVEYGAIVNEVMADSPAEEAGLKENDVIVGFNGSKVTDSDELVKFVEEGSAGDKVNLKIYRDGKERELTITLGTRQEGRNRTAIVTRLGKPNKKVLKYSYRTGEDKESYIGVSLTDLSKQLASYFGVQGAGVLISEVTEDSPAQKAGLKAGDVILSIGKEKVENASDVQDLIRDMKPGDKAELSLIRNKTVEKVSVEVAERDTENHYGFFHGPSVPDAPDVSIWTPHMKGLHFGRNDKDDDENEFEWTESELKEFKDELKAMKQELRSDDFRKEMEDLRRNLRDLERSLNDLQKKVK